MFSYIKQQARSKLFDFMSLTTCCSGRDMNKEAQQYLLKTYGMQNQIKQEVDEIMQKIYLGDRKFGVGHGLANNNYGS